MDRNGWKHKYQAAMVAINIAKDSKEESPQAKKEKQAIQDLKTILSEITKEKDIDLLLDLEKSFLNNELAHHTNSSEQKTSLLNALEQIGEAEKVLESVRNPEGYKILDTGFRKNEREQGLPIDTFHKFVNSERTRLGNKLKGVMTLEEKQIIRARRDLCGQMKALYKDLQREALGISKDKGLELGLKL